VSVALYDAAVITLHEIVDTPNDTWNLKQLHKEWKRFEHDRAKQQRVLDEVEAIYKKLHLISVDRHTRKAHKSKTVPMNES